LHVTTTAALELMFNNSKIHKTISTGRVSNEADKVFKKGGEISFEDEEVFNS
jgi:hypothetical protein